MTGQATMVQKAIGDEGAAAARAYPAPAVVVGVGRFGLAVLERLGESWASLHDAGADTGNLRLLHVRAARSDTAPAWRWDDRKVVAAAHVIQDSDLPAQTLNFLILRALGLIRYHGSMYEVAVPVDRGILDPGGDADAPNSLDTPEVVRRKRWFEWRPLNADPSRAVGLLMRRIERESDLGQFVSPLIQRVRRGHAPTVLMACVSRFMALMNGRDPSPWPWFQNVDGSGLSNGSIANLTIDSAPSGSVVIQGDGIVPSPLVVPGSPAFCLADGDTREAIEVEKGGTPAPQSRFEIKLPGLFLPHAGDICSGFDASSVLRVPWELTGWTAFEVETDPDSEFQVLDLGWLWLGLHDGLSQNEDPVSYSAPVEDLENGLKNVGMEVYRGLLALFLDMRRERARDYDVPLESKSWLEKRDESVEQSLDILAEFLYRKLRAEEKEIPIPEHAAWLRLSESASATLRMAGCDKHESGDDALSQIARRLRALGASDGLPTQENDLFSEVLIGEKHARKSKGSEAGTPENVEWEQGVLDFRRRISEAASSLLSLKSLERWRRDMLRSPPRLTVFIVADLHEPFVRATLRTLLIQAHAELLRSFEPLFHDFREGFERTLSIAPVLWSPQPAGAGSGAANGGSLPSQSTSVLDAAAKLRQAEEISIIEGLFEFRRTVEELPRGARCVPHIYVNSRVSEHAVLSIEDSVRQTHDFLSLHLRSDCARDEWLRELAVGPSGRDLFATFGCFEAAFPGERVREYLALRLGRGALRALRGEPSALREPESIDKWVSPLRVVAATAFKRLQRSMESASLERAETTRALLKREERPSGRTIARLFGDSWIEQQREELSAELRRATDVRGRIDEDVEEARRVSTSVASRDAQKLRERNDDRVRLLGVDATLTSLEVEFAKEVVSADAHACEAERERLEAEKKAAKSNPPDPLGRLAAASRRVSDAALRLPDQGALRVGVFVAVLLGAALLAPLVTSIAAVTGLLESPALEFLFGQGCMFAGAIVAAAASATWLWWLQKSRQEDVQRAVDAAADTVAGIVFTSPDSIFDFVKKRVALGMALAGRRLARRVDAAARSEIGLFRRLRRLEEFQELELRRRAERLGVKPDPDSRLDPAKDDLSKLFGSGSSEQDLLCDARSVVEHYQRTVGRDEDASPLLPEIISAAGGFDEWRKNGCLRCADAILRGPRALFENLSSESAGDLPAFSEVAERSLAEFVSRHYSTVSTGLGHMPSGGSEDTSTRVLSHATLVFGEGMRRLVKPSRHGGPLSTPSLSRREVGIRPNVVYLLSVIQGVAAGAAMPFRRYQSFFDRARHPGSPQVRTGKDEPIHILSGHKDLPDKLNSLLAPAPVHSPTTSDPVPPDGSQSVTPDLSGDGEKPQSEAGSAAASREERP